MASFQAKIGWKRLRRRENKFTLPLHSGPMRERKFQKNGKKTQKYQYGFIISQNRFEKSGKERK